MGARPAPTGAARTPRGALSVHLAALVVVPGCLALGWWQVTRALDGNTLSWVYSVEWPFFAAYALYMWWKLIHEEPVPSPWRRRSGLGPPGPEAPPAPAPAGGVGEEGSAPGPANGPAPGAADPPIGAPGTDEDELDRYNRYLEALHASGRRKRW